jgi:hypothetical protein
MLNESIETPDRSIILPESKQHDTWLIVHGTAYEFPMKAGKPGAREGAAPSLPLPTRLMQYRQIVEYVKCLIFS